MGPPQQQQQQLQQQPQQPHRQQRGASLGSAGSRGRKGDGRGGGNSGSSSGADWTCPNPKCGVEHNWASTIHCRRCKTPKPAGAGGKSAGNKGDKSAGDKPAGRASLGKAGESSSASSALAPKPQSEVTVAEDRLEKAKLLFDEGAPELEPFVERLREAKERATAARPLLDQIAEASTDAEVAERRASSLQADLEKLDARRAKLASSLAQANRDHEAAVGVRDALRAKYAAQCAEAASGAKDSLIKEANDQWVALSGFCKELQSGVSEGKPLDGKVLSTKLQTQLNALHQAHLRITTPSPLASPPVAGLPTPPVFVGSGGAAPGSPGTAATRNVKQKSAVAGVAAGSGVAPMESDEETADPGGNITG